MGNLLSGRLHNNPRNAREALVIILSEWIERLQLPRLGEYGVQASDLGSIIAHCRGGSMKTNPITLSDQEIETILNQRL